MMIIVMICNYRASPKTATFCSNLLIFISTMALTGTAVIDNSKPMNKD